MDQEVMVCKETGCRRRAHYTRLVYDALQAISLRAAHGRADQALWEKD